MKLRETDDYRIGLSVGPVEEMMTCREAVRLAHDLLKMAVAISDRADPRLYPLKTFEFETATIDPPTSAAEEELSGLLQEGRAIGHYKLDRATVMTFEEFLRNSGTIDFRVRVTPGDGHVRCYIHPQDRDGETFDFWVHGDNVIVIKQLRQRPKEDETLLVQTSEDEGRSIG